MIKNILAEGVERIFARDPEQLGLCHAILSVERIIVSYLCNVLLADDFVTDY